MSEWSEKAKAWPVSLDAHFETLAVHMMLARTQPGKDLRLEQIGEPEFQDLLGPLYTNVPDASPQTLFLRKLLR
jgi:hypothetical protein